METNACALFVVLIFMLSCGEKLLSDNAIASSVVDVDAGEDSSITYELYIKSILDARCVACHSSEKIGSERSGAPADIDLDTYLNAKDAAKNSNEQIQSGFMPPFEVLPDDEKELFQDWIDEGVLESDCSCSINSALNQQEVGEMEHGV